MTEPVPGTTRFTLQREWGIEHDSRSVASPLVFPFTSHWTDDRTCLIVDRGQPRNRLIEVAEDGRVVWSFDAAPRMNFAHRLNRDTVLFTQGNGVHLADRAGHHTQIFELAGDSAPNCGSVLGEWVAVGGDDGIELLTLEGKPLRHFRPDVSTFLEPFDLQLLASGHLLVTDIWSACVVELDREGRRVRTFGRWREPGRDRGALAAPYSGCRLRDGRTIVADWRANRLVQFAPDGRDLGELSWRDGARCFGPSYVRETPDGDLVVAETGGRRVTVRTPAGRVRWTYGTERPPRPTLAFPRSVQPIGGTGDLLVCDSFADRIVVLGADGTQRWSLGKGEPAGEDLGLSLPRSAQRDGTGHIAIADGLNSRVLVVDRTGRVHREVQKVRADRTTLSLQDPHAAEMVAEGLLIVDSDLAMVLLIDETDRVLARWGDETTLSDPHQARLSASGGVVVADSLNDRIAEFDRGGELVATLTHLVDEVGARTPLRNPRFVDLFADGDLLIADTNTGRVVRASRTGMLRWSAGPVVATTSDAVSPEIRAPKWAALDAQGRLVVADYYGSRVVALSAEWENR